MAISVGTVLGVMTGAVLLGGVAESRIHDRRLGRIPLRVHVNGTRGKTSVTRGVADLFRRLGKKTMAKATGTAPLWIDPEGEEHEWPRRGRVRVHEQMRFLRRAALRGAEVAVVECMAVDPVLQWICEHKFVRSHIGVITNVRRDHLEEMGADLEQIARSLANTIPRQGVLITADARFAPLFQQLAEPLGTRVIVTSPTEKNIAGTYPENDAIVREVARQAGFSDEAIDGALADLMGTLPAVQPTSTTLPAPATDAVWLHAWSINDTDSFRAFLNSNDVPPGRRIPLFNHRSDRPLRTLDFGRTFVETGPYERLLVTGDGGAERLLRRTGVPAGLIGRIPFPPTSDTVADAVRDVSGPVVVIGCGNARGLRLGKDGLP